MNCGKVVPHVDLLSHVWGVEYRNLTDYLSIFIRGLRNKIEPDPAQPRYILGGIESGYMFAAD
jgi:two-component system KDP operon response regulator KdpE